MPEFVPNFFLYLLLMAGTTYLVRMLPLVLVRGKIENRFIKSFLYYVPYAVLSAMTIPAIFFSTGHIASAICGTLVGTVLAYKKQSLIVVAACASLAVLFTEALLLVV